MFRPKRLICPKSILRGNDFVSAPQINWARLSKTIENPMVTRSEEICGALRNNLNPTNSMITPNRAVAKKATTNATIIFVCRMLIKVYATNAPIIKTSPCAKVTNRNVPKIRANPTATNAYVLP